MAAFKKLLLISVQDSLDFSVLAVSIKDAKEPADECPGHHGRVHGIRLAPPKAMRSVMNTSRHQRVGEQHFLCARSRIGKPT